MADELLSWRDGALGRIRLNRPAALNSLTFAMLQGVDAALTTFERDPAIIAVFIDGAGERGLCAGGDIRTLYESRLGDRDLYKAFWRFEYALNTRIAHYPKPYIALMDGLVMGGGVGISALGAVRLVTQRTRFAMPETRIGFVPDTGGSWLLGRRGAVGVYLALSGETIPAGDVIAARLADYFVDPARLDALIRQLTQIRTPEDIAAIMGEFAGTAPEAGIVAQCNALKAVFMRDRIEDVIAGLHEAAHPFGPQAAAQIRAGSPTSLRATHALLRRARAGDNLETCLTNEYRVACRLLEGTDLYEGIRAAIIDRDLQPRWSPDNLDAVNEAKIAAMFEADDDRGPIFAGRRPPS
jgi:enoyl-CoA hydratase